MQLYNFNTTNFSNMNNTKLYNISPQSTCNKIYLHCLTRTTSTVNSVKTTENITTLYYSLPCSKHSTFRILCSVIPRFLYPATCPNKAQPPTQLPLTCSKCGELRTKLNSLALYLLPTSGDAALQTLWPPALG